MVFFNDAKIQGVAIHSVGNKAMDDFYVLSDSLLTVEDENDYAHLMSLFSKPFSNLGQVYQLYHPNGVDLNIVDATVFDFFESNNEGLLHTSKFLAEHLYDVSNHPKVKGGEFYVVHFSGVQFEGEEFEAVGLFKSDNKEIYAKVSVGSDVVCEFTQAINPHHIDKAALILRSKTDDGYTVLIPEIKNATDRQYWKYDFLQIIARNDNNLKTSNFLKVYKNFVTEKLDETYELDVADKAELLNEGLEYFKSRETFEHEEFNEVVLGGGDVITGKFMDYLSDVIEENEIPISDSFSISNKAVKKATASYKSVIKLDKNFHLYVHGKRDLLERGYDEEKGLSYYKVYFENEG